MGLLVATSSEHRDATQHSAIQYGVKCNRPMAPQSLSMNSTSFSSTRSLRSDQVGYCWHTWSYFTAARPGINLSTFSTITVSDVVAGITKLPDISSAADPVLVPLLKQVATDIASFLAKLFNDRFKEAFVSSGYRICNQRKAFYNTKTLKCHSLAGQNDHVVVGI